MIERSDIFKCEGCGVVVEAMNCSKASLSCCGQEMVKLKAKTADSATEKHVPILESTNGGSIVKVGSVPHPMDDKHSIQWVEIINGDYVNRKYLKPGEKAEGAFYATVQDGMVVRELCNLHGLWINEG